MASTGFETHDLCDASAMLYQLSYEVTQLGTDQFVGSCVPVKGLDDRYHS